MGVLIVSSGHGRHARRGNHHLPPTGADTGRRNFDLIVAFGTWARGDGSGVGFDSSTGFLLPNGAERSPALAWVKRERWDVLTDDERRKFAPLCPDFVVELRSPSDRPDALAAKMVEHIENGTVLGWLIDPEERTVHVYRRGAEVTSLTSPVQISGDPELPGPSVDASIFW